MQNNHNKRESGVFGHISLSVDTLTTQPEVELLRHGCQPGSRSGVKGFSACVLDRLDLSVRENKY